MKNFRQLVSLCWDGRLIQFFDDQMQSWYYQVLLNSSILSQLHHPVLMLPLYY